MKRKKEIVITRHGIPADVLVGFKSEDDWFNYRPDWHARAASRTSVCTKGCDAHG